MPVFNILDQRRRNEWNPEVDVVFEVFADDWSDFGLPKTTQDFTEWMARMSVYDASMIAMRFAGKVTMYFYDPGWVGTNFGFIVTIHPKIKRDVLIPHEYDTRLLRNI